MKNKLYIICIAIIIILILIYSSYNIHNNQYENCIYGLYVSSDTYNEDADISMMRIFIGEQTKTKNGIAREARLLIDNNVTDQDITIHYKSGKSGFPFIMKPYKIIADVEFTKEKIWDGPITFEFDIMNNSLRIYSDNELLGFLYKDNELSNSFKYIDKTDSDELK